MPIDVKGARLTKTTNIPVIILSNRRISEVYSSANAAQVRALEARVKCVRVSQEDNLHALVECIKRGRAEALRTLAASARDEVPSGES